jgi:hypothetical protein
MKFNFQKVHIFSGYFVGFVTMWILPKDAFQFLAIKFYEFRDG